VQRRNICSVARGGGKVSLEEDDRQTGGGQRVLAHH